MDLLEKSTQSLEWPTLLRHYSDYCQSTPAKEQALLVEPAESECAAAALISLTSEALLLVKETAFAYLSMIDSLENPLLRLQKGLILDGKELFSVYKLMSAVQETQNFFSARRPNAGEECHVLTNAIARLANFAKLQPKILHSIEADGSVKDSATPKLKGLKDEERRLHVEAREKLDTVLQKAFRDGHLQDRFFDFRDGRYVIPVKNEHRNKIPGLIVESSATKATIFMEPASVRECNDRLKQTELAIQEEIYQILKTLSEELAPHGTDLQFAYLELLRLDLTVGRALFAEYFMNARGASRPQFTEDLALEGLYHPLLSFVIPSEKIVRNSLVLQKNSRVLIISGPNTGGKTVLLKSLGLCALMARAGFYLPCNTSTSHIPFFKNILAQIGDAQNLELSLSSFSGSVLGLKQILELGGKSSLVLIDEILHATDPDEATALSRAILEELEARGAMAVVTTHLNGLKVSFGSNFTSASMEFDGKEMQPTYRLRLGIPGSSHALEISDRLGLARTIVSKARGYLQKDHVQLEALVQKLETQEQLLAKEKEDVSRMQNLLQQEVARSKQLVDQLETQKKTLREKIQSEFEELQRKSLQQVESTIQEYKDKMQDVAAKHAAALEGKRRIVQVKEELESAQKKIEATLPAVKENALEEAKSFRVNQPVFIKSMKTVGVLISDPNDRKNPAQVLLGNMKMKIEWSQLSPREIAQAHTPKSHHFTATDDSSCPPELYLIGKTADEAGDLLALFLDKAARSGRPSVRIVHGLGSGVLRKVVRESLRKADYELKYRPGQANEGGEGCTVVEFT